MRPRPRITILPKVKRIGPDEFTFSHNPDSPIWVEFSLNMDESSINSNTVVVKAYPNGDETLVQGSIVKGQRVAMFLPNENYPTGVGDTDVILTLVGTDVGSGAIKANNGVPLDGDGDGEEGGDFVYNFWILG